MGLSAPGRCSMRWTEASTRRARHYPGLLAALALGVLLAAATVTLGAAAQAAGLSPGAVQAPGDCPLPPYVRDQLIRNACTEGLLKFPPLRYPAVETLDDVTAHLEGMYFPADAFSNAYANMTLLGHELECVDGLSCRYQALSVDYDVSGMQHKSYAFFRESQAGTGENAMLIIPGTGENQSTKIYINDASNYHHNIAEIVRPYWDMYVYVKPNEDFLAVHNGYRKLSQEAIVYHLANDGGSYSCRYIADSMCMVRYLKNRYDRVVVAGLSQGGQATLYNAVQSKPDGAIVSSGYSVIREELSVDGLSQILIPGMTEYHSRMHIFNAIRDSDTEYLFTWGTEEEGAYFAEVRAGCTARFFSALDNVQCLTHAGGHEFPEAEVSAFLWDMMAPVARICASPCSLDFGEVYTGYASSCDIVFKNTGTAPLSVGDVSCSAAEFTPGLASFEVAPGDSAALAIDFLCESEGEKLGTLTVRSNDPLEPELSIPLKASVLRPPAIALSPDSIYAVGNPTETVTHTILMENRGPSDLLFEARALSDTTPGSSAIEWLDVAPAEGTLAPGQREELILAFDGAGLQGKRLGGGVLVLSNDPLRPSAWVPVELLVIGEFTLYPSLPSPARGRATIAFDVPAACHARVEIFDARGRLVRKVIDGRLGPGRHREYWDGRDSEDRKVPSGVYALRMVAPGYTASQKLVMVK